MSHPPIESSITFFYTHDFDISARFYEDRLGLELWLDQGSCRIYRVSGDGYVGLCQTSGTKTPLVDKQSNVIFTLVTPQVDEWFNYLTRRGVEFEKPPQLNEKYNIYHCFLRDPNGYLIEIQRFENALGRE
ncbi:MULTISPECIES: VOC family protein [unclassified Coleofasciculus]|uniref:VOC family protein n=1 Tax=unclassified Coleofasciculus TaxID=2692782 RepID=UPI00187FA3B2|nr:MULTISPECIES: VOC family protein [unclassified Coleofasciculus]MBE9127912.1 VOC family protein [Coleofasciculus sp. LEGE 07081]MBE9150624.1 VOC family protein [Coleofasciculus sp. LEGE 07092]